MSNAQDFKLNVNRMAGNLLTQWVGEERAAEATGRILAAFSASAMSARDPRDFYACTPVSVAQCIATAALTGIMPSTGATALAYLVPQRARRGEAPQLQYMLSHRGIAALAKRAGMLIYAIPVGHDDKLEVSGGEVVEHSADIDNPPTTLKELRGCIVIVKASETGMVLFRGWVPMKLIEARRAESRSAGSSYSPWSRWPVEMSQKTALHYAIGRAWVVIDDAEAVRALQAEQSTAVIDTTAAPARSGLAALGLSEEEPKALQDHGEEDDFDADPASDERELVHADSNTHTTTP